MELVCKYLLELVGPFVYFTYYPFFFILSPLSFPLSLLIHSLNKYLYIDHYSEHWK